MATERAILCGTVGDASLPFADPRPVHLHLWGSHRNIQLTIQDVQQAMLMAVPSVLRDLLDIAVYVYVGDQAVTRGGAGVQDIGENWRRRLFFRIPVRERAVWRNSRVVNQLVSTLSFLSEDEYQFDFQMLGRDQPFDQFLEFAETPFDGLLDDVVMFSGGSTPWAVRCRKRSSTSAKSWWSTTGPQKS
jgi:hypothetical protein